MQRLMGLIRKASEEYGLLEDGDRIAVGVSGGKDSVAMLYALNFMRRYLEQDYSLVAVTLDMDFPGSRMDFSLIRDLCADMGVEYHVKKTEIGRIIFSEREEQNPCSLCARMRRGSLHDAAIIETGPSAPPIIPIDAIEAPPPELPRGRRLSPGELSRSLKPGLSGSSS